MHVKTFSTSEGPSVRDLGWRPLSPQDPGPCTRKHWETGGSISCHSGCVPEAACILLAAQLWLVTFRLCLSVTLMSEWQEGLPSLIMIHTLKLKQLESSTDVSTMRSDVLLQHVTSESRENRDSLRGKGLPGGYLPITRQRRFCLFPRIPPHTHTSCSVFSHHVLREAGRGPAAVQDGRDRGAVRVRHCHGHVLLRPLGHDQEHLRGRSGGARTARGTARNEARDGTVGVAMVVLPLATFIVP